MCRNICNRYEKTEGSYRYCESCRRFIEEKNLYREAKKLNRYRCSCCRGLVRTNVRKFYKISQENYFFVDRKITEFILLLVFLKLEETLNFSYYF